MDAKLARIGSLFLAVGGLLLSVVQSTELYAQSRSTSIHTFATPNFVVHANNPQWARQVGEAAEANRRDLAIHWLGHELPRWSKPCPLMVNDHPTFAASGETKYTIIPERGAVVNFNMTVRGTRERIIDSVLPHEITHTIVASHFAPLGKTVPRWADEGMCTTVEHEAERRKHDIMLVQFLRQGKGISFETLFALQDYPADILPLYAQGYSLTSFLIAQGGPKQFIKFLEHGMSKDDWNSAINQIYGYPLKGKLQTAWNRWVAEGGGDVSRHTAVALGYSGAVALASNTQSTTADNNVRLASNLAASPVSELATRPTPQQRSLPSTVTEARPSQFIPSQPSQPNSTYPNNQNHLSRNSTSPDNFVPPSLSRQALSHQPSTTQASVHAPDNANQVASNTQMHPSGSYYLQRLQENSGTNQEQAPIRVSGGHQHAVSQPGPLQTIGGDLIYR